MPSTDADNTDITHQYIKGVGESQHEGGKGKNSTSYSKKSHVFP